MKDLHELLQQKLMEDEFKNEKTVDLESADLDMLFKERVRLKKQMESYSFQANQLIDRLYKLQKTYFDNMVIIDESTSTGLGRPWKVEQARHRWKWWPLNTTYLAVSKTISEVAIRTADNEKQVAMLEKLCHRLNYLNDLQYDAHKLSKSIKEKLNTEYGSFSDD